MKRADVEDDAAMLHRWAWIAAAMLLALVIVYAPLRSAGFTWDDDDHFVDNPAMTRSGGLVEIWTSGRAVYYPLTLSVWWVLRRLVDLEPLPYHLVNVACHAATALLLAMLLSRWRFPAPALAASLWMLHPVQVETAAWATELKNTLSGVLLMASLHAWLSFLRAEQQRGWWYAGSMVALALSLLAKPSTVPAAGLLVLMAVWERRRLGWRDALTFVLPFAMAGAWAAWTIHEQKHNSNAQGYEWDLSLAQRLLLAANTPVFYLQKVLVPYPLMFIYARWNLAAPDLAMLLRPLVLVGLAGFLIHAHLGNRDARGWPRAMVLAMLAWLGLLFPVCGLFVIYFQRFSYVGDHFQYLASIVPCAVVAWLVWRWVDPQARVPTMLALIAAAGLWSNQLVPHYRNAETLWRWTIAENPQAWIAHNNLGNVLWERGEIDAAAACFERALELKPDYDEALNNLGVIALERDDPALAESLFRRAIEVRPTYGNAMSNLASALASQRRLAEATEWQLKAFQWMEPDATLYADLGTLMAAQGEMDKAVAAYEQAVRLDPTSTEYAARLAVLRQASGVASEPD